jgi:hypothetical protein
MMLDSTELGESCDTGATTSSAGVAYPTQNQFQAPYTIPPLPMPHLHTPRLSLGSSPSATPSLAYSHPSTSSEYQYHSGMEVAFYDYGYQPPRHQQPAAPLPPYSDLPYPPTQHSTVEVSQHGSGVHPLHLSITTTLPSASASLNHNDPFNLPAGASLLDNTPHYASPAYPHFADRTSVQADTLPQTFLPPSSPAIQRPERRITGWPAPPPITPAQSSIRPPPLRAVPFETSYRQVGVLGLDIYPRRLGSHANGEAGPSGGAMEMSSWRDYPAALCDDEVSLTIFFAHFLSSSLSTSPSFLSPSPHALGPY